MSHLSVLPSNRPSIIVVHPSIQPTNYLFVCPSNHLFVHPSVHLPIHACPPTNPTNQPNPIQTNQSIHKQLQVCCELSLRWTHLGLSVLERCPSQRGLSQRDVRIREIVSVLERCLFQRDVYLREMSVLERCLSQRDVCLREMFVLERCPSQRDVHLREMFVLDRCPSQREFFNRK